GSRRFHGYLRARSHHDEDLDLSADQVQAELEPQALPPGDFTYPLYPLFRMPQVDGNHCQLLPSGADTYTDMFRAISAARHSVCVQFYILRDDRTGQQLAELLCDKARQRSEEHTSELQS